MSNRYSKSMTASILGPSVVHSVQRIVALITVLRIWACVQVNGEPSLLVYTRCRHLIIIGLQAL